MTESPGRAGVTHLERLVGQHQHAVQGVLAHIVVHIVCRHCNLCTPRDQLHLLTSLVMTWDRYI